jgi:Ax21 family sulfation-dependent quorum factor
MTLRPLSTLATLALFAALPLAARAADGLSYNYVEGGYVATNTDPADADGWGVNGSAALSDNFHLFGGYAKQDLKDFDANFDQWRFGLGYNRAIAPNADLLARVAYENVDAGGGISSDGYSVEAGLRGALAPSFEGYALAGYEDGNDIDGDFYGRLGATAKFNPNWGVTAEVKLVQGGDNQWFVGPRFTW